MKKDMYVKISIGLILIAYMMFLLFRPISEFLINKNDLLLLKATIIILILMILIYLFSVILETKAVLFDMVNRVLFILIMGSGIYFSIYKVVELWSSSLCEMRKIWFTLGFTGLSLVFIGLIARLLFVMIKSKKRT